MAAGRLAGWVVVLGFAATASGQEARIRIKGSDTMRPLVERWAEGFMVEHPGVAVSVEGGGTSRGTEALILGRADIAAASRPLRADESRRLAETYGTLGYSALAGRDALSIYVHPSNPVASLTVAELRAIFTGAVRRWEEVGGAPGEIRVLNRNPASGSRLFFREHLLGGESFARRARTLPTTAAIVDAVRSDPGAIGYGGIGAAAGVRLCAIDGVLPSEDHVRDGSYPIARYLYLYTAEPPSGRVRAFIDWVLGEDGQAVVRGAGYVPLR